MVSFTPSSPLQAQEQTLPTFVLDDKHSLACAHRGNINSGLDAPILSRSWVSTFTLPFPYSAFEHGTDLHVRHKNELSVLLKGLSMEET